MCGILTSTSGANVLSMNVGTHSAGAALDLVMMSSSCSGSVRVHNGMGCCNHAPGCCPLLGSDHCLCVAATTFRQQVRAQVPRCLPPLRARSLAGPGWCPSSRGTFLTSIVPVTVVNPLGGLLNAWPCALPAMVLGGISADPVPRRPIPVSGLPGWLSIELCAGANACFGPIGRNVLRPFPVLVLVSLLQWFVELFPLPAGWIMRLVSCGSLPPTSPRPRMSVPPIGASISLPLALPLSASTMSSLRKSRRRFHVINSQPVVPGLFDGPFTPSELRRALTLCFDSAVGIDGLPYSVFKTNLPWWQSAVLHFFNLVLSIPVFKRGDPSLPTNFRPISLASCCFKIFEHLVHARIGPHISPQLDECQGGFRWGADSLVGSLVDLLTSRSSHTFCGFHRHS